MPFSSSFSFDAVTSAIDHQYVPTVGIAEKVIRLKKDFYEIVKYYKKKTTRAKKTIKCNNEKDENNIKVEEKVVTEESTEYVEERRRNRLAKQCTDNRAIVVANFRVSNELGNIISICLKPEETNSLFQERPVQFTPLSSAGEGGGGEKEKGSLININIGCSDDRTPVTLGIESVEAYIPAGLKIYCQGLLQRDTINDTVVWSLTKGTSDDQDFIVQKGSRTDHEGTLCASIASATYARDVTLKLGTGFVLCGLGILALRKRF